MNWETIFDHHINSSELENLYGFSDITKTEYLSDLKSINNAQDIAYGLISKLYKLRGDNETALKQQKSGTAIGNGLLCTTTTPLSTHYLKI